MIVSYSPSGPTTALALGNTHLRVSTSAAVDLGVLFRIGAWGFLTLYKAEGHAGFTKDKRGAWASPRFSQAPNAAWKGQAFWVQGVVVDTLGNFLDTTNVVRVSLD
jgi:hypothetical protein